MAGTGRGILARARQHIGEQYVNVQVPKNNANWPGPWDCAEFASWLVFQEAGILYGCVDDNAAPAVADAYTGAWQTDSANRGNRISIDQAAGTVGAMVLRFPPQPGTMGHIAVCDGNGGTVEAMDTEHGVATSVVHGRRWDTGVLIPGVTYDPAGNVTVTAPPLIYRQGATGLDRNIVRAIQQALVAASLNPGGIDGMYGPHTAAAVAAFQTMNGLVSDGEVGPLTAQKLHVTI
jgi:putative peptidoglycan binding protein